MGRRDFSRHCCRCAQVVKKLGLGDSFVKELVGAVFGEATGSCARLGGQGHYGSLCLATNLIY